MFLSLTIVSLILGSPISYFEGSIMPTIAIRDYTGGADVGAVTMDTGSTSQSGATKYVEVSATKPFNGKKSVTATVLDNIKSGLRNRKISYNVPRLNAPVGTNPATGLPFPITVKNSITIGFYVIAPPDVSDAEIGDAIQEMAQISQYSMNNFLKGL
ncbi:TPA_asm: coat protein [ssRNA phage AIN001]|uniref:Coat protein n=2 Tax=Riboviria TaxID=2559587 RepID=A0A8S5KY64_9VIRU|nr:coat protein [ssRNA phage AIN001]APG77219.1 hypothetical protein [Hubei levi-like virus 12]DAD49842.1 TPA_asm: coat protein [ssRNA phage AIN001]